MAKIEKSHDHFGHRNRLRDRVRKEGLDNFEDYQVLEYVLSFVIPYKDTNPLAHQLIKKFGSLGNVFEANEEDLMDVQGLGSVSANFLTSIPKIFNYYEKEKINKITIINSPQSAYQYMKGLFAGKQYEEIYLICLTPKNKVVSTQLVAKGTIGEAHVAMRQITDIISRNKVNDIIIAHNHPNGNVTPSYEDDKFTKALVASLAINNCNILDHVIYGEDEYYSYRNSGKIQIYLEEVASLFSNKQVSQNRAIYRSEDDKK